MKITRRLKQNMYLVLLMLGACLFNPQASAQFEPGLSDLEIEQFCRTLTEDAKLLLIQEQQPTHRVVAAAAPLAEPAGTPEGLLYPLSDGDWTLAIAENDDSYAEYSIPFTFLFYGTPYTDLFVNNNGNLSFGRGFSTFTSSGFPVNGFPMMAAFWGDVDTRSDLGDVYYKHIPEKNTFVVTWDNVGYYNRQGDKRNTFQIAISDGTNPDMGVNNVCFSYNDMQWTTGSASSGSGGFGGTPATVGVNKGDGGDFAQIGRFDHAGIDYDGPGGVADGVDYLDGQRFFFNISGLEANIPPVAQGFPLNNEITVQPGTNLDLTIQFSGPELGETVTAAVTDLNGVQARGMTISSSPGNPATANLNWTPLRSDAGSYELVFTATDDGTPAKQSTTSLIIEVPTINQPPVADANGPYAIAYSNNTAELDASGSTDPDVDEILTYAWDLNNDGQFDDATGSNPLFTWPATAAPGTILTVSVKVTDSFGETDTAQSTVTKQIAPLPDEALFAKIGIEGGNQALVLVDHLVNPGLSEVIGDIKFGNINAMDFDPDGTFFAIGKRPEETENSLISIDPATGEGIRIGGPPTGVSTSLASDPNGILYGSAGPALYRVDKMTGLSSLVGPIEWDTENQGSDFGPNGNYYMLTRSQADAGVSPALLEIDPNTGSLIRSVEFTVDFGSGPESMLDRTGSYDVSFSQDGILYASVSIDGMSWLLTIDLNTGTGTPLGQMIVSDGNITVSASSLTFGPIAWANKFPIAIITGPENIELSSGTETEVTLDGSQSYDPDADSADPNPLEFEWSDPADNILGTNQTLTSLLSLGSHTFNLTVTDAFGKSDTASHTVNITPATNVCMFTTNCAPPTTGILECFDNPYFFICTPARTEEPSTDWHKNRTTGQTFTLNTGGISTIDAITLLKGTAATAWASNPHTFVLALLKDTDGDGLGDQLVAPPCKYDFSGLVPSTVHSTYFTFQLGSGVPNLTDGVYQVEVYWDEVAAGNDNFDMGRSQGEAYAGGHALAKMPNDGTFPIGEDMTVYGSDFTFYVQGSSAVPLPPFAIWTASSGLTPGVNDSPTDNPDGDSMNNCMEYAVNGNPLVVDQVASTFVDSSFFYHVHNQRTDDPQLTFIVETCTNLCGHASWTTSGVELVGESAPVDSYKSVTNRTIIGDCGSMRLTVEKN